MANKLSWNPPKWKSYTFDGYKFKVELETGEVYEGRLSDSFIAMQPNHPEICYKIFGTFFTKEYSKESIALSKVLDLTLGYGYWPDYSDVSEFLERYYERVAKIGNSNTSKIYIETEFDITPKFTI